MNDQFCDHPIAYQDPRTRRRDCAFCHTIISPSVMVWTLPDEPDATVHAVTDRMGNTWIRGGGFADGSYRWYRMADDDQFDAAYPWPDLVASFHPLTDASHLVENR